MKIVSHIRSAMSMSCVEKITVVPLRLSVSTASLSASILSGSSPVKGSSSTSSFGRAITAEMNCTFWAMPFESASHRFAPAGRAGSVRATGRFRRGSSEIP